MINGSAGTAKSLMSGILEENKYWDMFECEELVVGKHWDGHTEKDVTRLLAL